MRYNELRHVFTAKNWGLLKGLTVTLQMHPMNAVQISLDALLAQGFRLYPEDVAATLALEGSPWTAAVVEIGTAQNWGHTFVSDVLADTPIGLLMKLRSKVGQMFVIATARELPGGICELIVMPHEGGGDPDHSKGARPRLDAAITQILDQTYAAGVLVEAGEPSPATKIKDPSCPASYKKFRSLMRLNWRGAPRKSRR